MKTTSQVYTQYLRISKTMSQISHREIEKADPNTGGNEMLCNNWGNGKAKSIMHFYMDRSSKLNEIYTRTYKKAFVHEYPEHLASKSYFNI